MKDKERVITDIWLNYLEESKTNKALTPEEYLKRYPQYQKDLAALLKFTEIGQQVLGQDLTPLVNKMKSGVWAKVQANLDKTRQEKSLIAAFFKRAVELYHEGRFSKTLDMCDEVLRRDRDHPSALRLKASILLYEKNEADKALKLLERLTQLTPQDGFAWLGKAEVYLAQKRLNLAFEALQKAQHYLSLPQWLIFSADLYNNLGEGFIAQGNLPLAEKSFLEAIKINQQRNRTEALELNYAELGSVYERQANRVAYVDVLRKLLELHQKMNKRAALADDYFTLGQLHHAREPKAAAENFRQALQLYKELNQVKDIGWCYRILGDLALKEGSLESGRNHLMEADKIAQSLSDKELAVITHLELAKIDEITSNLISAVNRRKQVLKWTKAGVKIRNKDLFTINYLALAQFYGSHGQKALARKMINEANKGLGKMPEKSKEKDMVKIEMPASLYHETLRETIRKERGSREDKPTALRLREELLQQLRETSQAEPATKPAELEETKDTGK
jgi:tetratricopeptide (TPR) repeat protein